jgi:hypothetical protein
MTPDDFSALVDELDLTELERLASPPADVGAINNVDQKRAQFEALSRLMTALDKGLEELRSAVIAAIGAEAFEPYEFNARGALKIHNDPPKAVSQLLPPPLFGQAALVQAVAELSAKSRHYATLEKDGGPTPEPTDRAIATLQRFWTELNHLRAEWSAIEGTKPKLSPLPPVNVPVGLSADGTGADPLPLPFVAPSPPLRSNPIAWLLAVGVIATGTAVVLLQPKPNR